MRRLYCFIVAATVTAALAASSAAAASVTTELSGAAAAAGCAQVTFIGVKGSGDGSSGAGMGTTIAALAASFTADLPGRVTVVSVPVVYPAVPVLDAIDDGLFNGVNYPTSVARGVRALGDLVSQHLGACPSTQVVLAGYSQGADVVETYLDSTQAAAVRGQIAAVGLLGDPRFNPSDSAVDVGSFNPKYGPVYGKFGIPPNSWNPEGRRPVIPALLRTKTISACNEGDPICNYSWSNMAGCIGVNAWQSYYASIVARTLVPVPELRASCAHLHYRDSGPGVVTPGSKVTVTAVGRFLAGKAQEIPWTTARAPLPADASNSPSVTLGSVACGSATSCVAAGQYYDSSSNLQGLLERLSGTTWTAVRAPTPTGAAADPQVQLSSVTCSSASSCIAVGNYSDSAGNQQGLVETLSGTTWTPTKLLQPADGAQQVVLSSVACPTTSSCIAVGSYTDSSDILHALLAARSGTTWTAITGPLPADAVTPPASYLDTVACASASSCIAGGSYNDSSGRHDALLEALAGRSWAATAAPPPADSAFDPDDILYSASCTSASTCVGAGYYTNSAGNQEGMLETQAGTTWASMAAPLPTGAASNPDAVLYQDACLPASCAAVGYYLDSSGSGQGLLLRRSGATWKAAKAALPAGAAASPYVGLSSVACSTASACVSVGGYTDISGSQQGLLETLSGTTWTAAEAQLPADANTKASVHLYSVACPSASWCVAVGGYRNLTGNGQGLLLTGPG